MSSPMRPSTPVAQTSTTPSTPQTGTWRHPRLDEIARRQNATSFTDRNVKKILYNIGCFVVLWLLEKLVRAHIPEYFPTPAQLIRVSWWTMFAARLMLVFNIIVAIRPALQRKDDLSDIPLTPGQRKLLGLPPSSGQPTPEAQYITPPRYPRSPAPQSGSPISKNTVYSTSPLSGKGSPGFGTPKGSPNASPLIQKAFGGVLNGSRRPSYGSPSPLGPGLSRAGGFDTPGTPTPSLGKGTSVGLNNRWLYEKGRASPGNTRLYS